MIWSHPRLAHKYQTSRWNVRAWWLKRGGFGPCILHPSSSKIISHTGATMITLSSSFGLSTSAFHSCWRGAKLTRSGADSRIGLLSTRSKYQFHSLAHLHWEYSTSRPHHNYQPVPSWCMDFYTLLTALRLQDQCGQPGDLWWNGTADMSSEVQCKVGSTHSQVSTIASLKRLSWRWQRWGTGSQRPSLSNRNVDAPWRINSPTVCLVFITILTL